MGDPVSVAAPLAGVRVVTTRSASGDDRLRALLEAAGAEVLAWPTSEYPPPLDPGPLEAARARLDRFDWVVFTSARALAAVVDVPTPHPPGRRGGSGHRPRRSRGRLGGRGGGAWAGRARPGRPGGRHLPARGRARALSGRLGAAPTVEEEFTAFGARVTRVDAYRTVVTPPRAERVRADLAAGVDAVTFASPSAVEAVDRALGGEMAGSLAGLTIVCIGPTTATALERRGVSDVRVAATATLEGMVEAVVARTGARPLGAPS